MFHRMTCGRTDKEIAADIPRRTVRFAEGQAERAGAGSGASMDTPEAWSSSDERVLESVIDGGVSTEESSSSDGDGVEVGPFVTAAHLVIGRRKRGTVRRAGGGRSRSDGSGRSLVIGGARSLVEPLPLTSQGRTLQCPREPTWEEQLLQLLLGGHAEGTGKAYTRAWKMWTDFMSIRQQNPFLVGGSKAQRREDEETLLDFVGHFALNMKRAASTISVPPPRRPAWAHHSGPGRPFGREAAASTYDAVSAEARHNRPQVAGHRRDAPKDPPAFQRRCLGLQ